MTESVWKKCERCEQRFPPIRLYTCGPGGLWTYCAECLARAEKKSEQLSEAELDCRKRLSDVYEGQYRTGVFTNCGYHGTASGWIVRDGTYWIATFRSQDEADDYVTYRSHGSAVKSSAELST